MPLQPKAVSTEPSSSDTYKSVSIKTGDHERLRALARSLNMSIVECVKSLIDQELQARAPEAKKAAKK